MLVVKSDIQRTTDWMCQKAVINGDRKFSFIRVTSFFSDITQCMRADIIGEGIMWTNQCHYGHNPKSREEVDGESIDALN